MRTLRIGIGSLEEIKSRTIAIARGDLRKAASDPNVWFPSIESVAKILSADNRTLLDSIIMTRPTSLDELEKLTGRQKSNLSRTLHTMARYGIVRLDRGERGRIIPIVLCERFSVDFSLSAVAANTRNQAKAL